MKKNQIIIPFLLLILVSSFAFSQNSGDFKKAMKAFDNLEYGKAETIFKRAYSRSNDRLEKNKISFKLAQCYFFLGDYKKAEMNLRRTLKMRHDNPLVYYYLAECYKGMEKFEKAQEQYEIYSSLAPDDPKGINGIKSLELSQKWIIEGSKYRVLNAGKINSSSNDYSPALNPKAKNDQYKFYFTSSRDGALGKNLNHQTGQPFSDIFRLKGFSKKDKARKKNTSNILNPDDKWDVESITNTKDGLEEVAVNLKNSEEGVISFDGRGNKMYFTRALFSKNKYQGRRIFSAELRGNVFEKTAMEVIPVDTLVDLHGPSVSSDNKMLFFSAEIEGGFGGSDIYVSKYDRRKKSWGEPQNLGENINSSGNEAFAHYNSDTKNLYFSSDGRMGMGGLDIFKAEHNPSISDDVTKMFQEAENLRYPINTCYDDFGITFEDEKESAGIPEMKGYFSSNRVGSRWKSKGNTDIYYFDKKRTYYNLKGKVIDVADGAPIKGAKVELIGPRSSKVKITKKDGTFNFSDENFFDDEDYRLTVNKDWFFQVVDTTISTSDIRNEDLVVITEKHPLYSDDIDKMGHDSYEMTRMPIEMRTMRRPLVLKSVLFDLGKSDLRNESKAELDSLASLLNNDWPNHVIELRSHTDFRGSDTLNTRLSFDRALSCVDYLVSVGVDSRRLIPVGMADTEPTVLTSETMGLSPGSLSREYIERLKTNSLKEMAHQKNRRTDFKVLSTDFESWLENPENVEKSSSIKDATIKKDGKVVPMKKSSGNYLQQPY